MPCHQFIQAILPKSRAMSGLSRMKESSAKEIPICAELKCSLISFSGKPPFSDIKSHPGTEQRQLYFDPLADSFPPSFSPVLLPWFSFSSCTKALLLLIFTCWNIAFSVLKGFATTSTLKCCFILCFIISSFRLNPFSQTPHSFDFSPLCVLKCLLERMQSHTGCICLFFLHCVFSNVSSNCLPEMMHNYTGCICLTFLHCAFSNVSSNCLRRKMYNHTGCICLTTCIGHSLFHS